MTKHIAIVGAGVAGLAAAGDLQAAGWEVTLYEKSRGLGGRVATRREGLFRFDHGAQYVKATAGRLRSLVEACRDEDGAAVYDIGLPIWTFTGDGQIAEGDAAQNAEPKWCWPSGVNALAKHMARGLTIRREVEIGSIHAEQGAGYTLRDRAGAGVGAADRVLFTAPAPQTAAIIRASELEAGGCEQLLAALGPATYRRCISITLAYPRRPEVPWYALINSDRGHSISWLACEHVKAGHAPAPAGLITLQMAHSWSTAHYDELAKGQYGEGAAPPPAAIAQAREMGEALLGTELGAPLWINVQRWGYALPDSGASFEALNSGAGGCYVAGDGVVGQGRVHLAIESGWRVAEIIGAA